jgi:hypothetical protein
MNKVLAIRGSNQVTNHSQISIMVNLNCVINEMGGVLQGFYIFGCERLWDMTTSYFANQGHV